MAETQRRMTPMQRFVYVTAKNYHTDDPEEKTPTTINKGHQATRGF